MANALNNLPSYEQPFMVGNMSSKDWFFFLAGLYNGIPPEGETPVALGASPYVYTNDVKGTVIIFGGTVTLVEFSRNGSTYYSTGQTAGMFTVNSKDFLRITYAVAPTVTFVPT